MRTSERTRARARAMSRRELLKTSRALRRSFFRLSLCALQLAHTYFSKPHELSSVKSRCHYNMRRIYEEHMFSKLKEAEKKKERERHRNSERHERKEIMPIFKSFERTRREYYRFFIKTLFDVAVFSSNAFCIFLDMLVIFFIFQQCKLSVKRISH